MRRLSALDRLIEGSDQALRTLVPGASQAQRQRPQPADRQALAADNPRLSAALMRINHCGEVCAQALYQGQALTARLPAVRAQMAQAAIDERDHLVWCEQRIGELNGRTSALNPLFYLLSFALGASAGLAGDDWSLGFIAATEEQVCEHLRGHLATLAQSDAASCAILAQMLDEEQVHGAQALDAGARQLPPALAQLMPLLADVMRRSTFYL